MGRTISLSARYTFQVNREVTWRDRVGMALRRLAGWVDHRPPLAIFMSSQPKLTVQQQAEVLTFGFQQMEWALNQVTRIQAIETGMKDMSPELFKKDIQ